MDFLLRWVEDTEEARLPGGGYNFHETNEGCWKDKKRIKVAKHGSLETHLFIFFFNLWEAKMATQEWVGAAVAACNWLCGTADGVGQESFFTRLKRQPRQSGDGSKRCHYGESLPTTTVSPQLLLLRSPPTDTWLPCH